MNPRRKAKRTKKAAIEFSFTTIFALILIAVAFFVALWGIRKFLVFGDKGKVATFKQDLREAIEQLYGASGSRLVELSLPTKVKEVYLIDCSSGCSCNDLPSTPSGSAYSPQGVCQTFCQPRVQQGVALMFYPYEPFRDWGLNMLCSKVEGVALPSDTYVESTEVKDGKVRIRLSRQFGASKVIIQFEE